MIRDIPVFETAIMPLDLDKTMAFFRQYIAPLLIFSIFFLTLIVVSARAFLPEDMLVPAPYG
jgi:hypothetical protein